jgi:hypothetical protein
LAKALASWSFGEAELHRPLAARDHEAARREVPVRVRLGRKRHAPRPCIPGRREGLRGAAHERQEQVVAVDGRGVGPHEVGRIDGEIAAEVVERHRPAGGQSRGEAGAEQAGGGERRLVQRGRLARDPGSRGQRRRADRPQGGLQIEPPVAELTVDARLPRSSALSSRMRATSSGCASRCGHWLMINAAPPLTIGAAAEVPSNLA